MQQTLINASLNEEMVMVASLPTLLSRFCNQSSIAFRSAESEDTESSNLRSWERRRQLEKKPRFQVSATSDSEEAHGRMDQTK